MRPSAAQARLRHIASEELFDRALEAQRQSDGRPEDVSFLVALQERGDPTTHSLAERLVQTGDSDQQILGLRVLAEFKDGFGRRVNGQQTAEFIAAKLPSILEPSILYWALRALAWQHEPTTVDVILRYARHPKAIVRQAVAEQLPLYFLLGAPSADIVAALLKLGADKNADVRYYAVAAFAAEVDADSPEIAALLTLGLTDPDAHVREAAADGLDARRQPPGDD